MQRRHDYAFHLEDGGSVSINGIFHDRLPLLHAFLAVLLQVCVSLLECSKVHLLTLPNQRVVLLHTSNKMNSSSDIAGSGCSAPTYINPKWTAVVTIMLSSVFLVALLELCIIFLRSSRVHLLTLLTNMLSAGGGYPLCPNKCVMNVLFLLTACRSLMLQLSVLSLWCRVRSRGSNALRRSG